MMLSVTQRKGAAVSRRIVSGTCWLVLVFVLVLKASGPSHGLPEVEGVWDGFYVTADGATGLVSSDITEQDFRRLAGDGVLFDLEGGDVTYRFRATLARPDF